MKRQIVKHSYYFLNNEGTKTGKENPPTMNYSYMLLSFSFFFFFLCLSSHHSFLKLWDWCPRLLFTRVTLSSSHLCSHGRHVHLSVPQTWIKTPFKTTPFFCPCLISSAEPHITALTPPPYKMFDKWQNLSKEITEMEGLIHHSE